MNADELYEKMKDALRFFGLSFHQKDLVTVKFGNGCVQFVYGDACISYRENVS